MTSKKEDILYVIPLLFVGKNKNNLSNLLAKKALSLVNLLMKWGTGIGEVRVCEKVWEVLQNYVFKNMFDYQHPWI